jgi:mannosyltransferase OCH1-like enzyme
MTDKEKEQAGVRMTQEEIISQLENLKSHCEDMHKRNDINDVNDVWKRDVEALTAAIKAIEQQPRWIPCSERLPERDESVLTYHRDVSFDYQYVSWIDDYSGK